MDRKLHLLSTDFDGTLVAHGSDPVLDRNCMELIREIQRDGGLWAVNTGRSVEFLESGLIDFDFPIRPDFILTSERDVFRPAANASSWEAFGDWNDRCARDHADLFASASSVLADVLAFVGEKTSARVVYEGGTPAGLVAQSEEEMDRVTEFIDRARHKQPKFHYQRNMVYLRFSHVDYHKGAALAELSRLLGMPREEIFAAGDHHNDISMLDGRYAEFPACPANAIPEVKTTVRAAGGYVAEREHGAGIHEALLYYTS